MKNLLMNVAVIAILSLFLASCADLKDMIKNADKITYKVDPSPLAMNGEKVDISISGKFPPKYFNKNVVVEATPVLKYGEKTIELKKMVFQGEKVKDNFQKISYENGGTFSMKDNVPYVNEMREATLVLKLKGTYKGKSEDLGEVKKLADGTTDTPRLVEKGLQVDNPGYESVGYFPKANTTSVALAPTTNESLKGEIFYAIQDAKVSNKELKGENLKKFNQEVSAAFGNKFTFKGIEVAAYASPDGPLDLNTKLSESRGKTASDYITASLVKSKLVDKTVSSNVKTQNTAEDWDGFKSLVEKSNIKDKELIVRVLSMYPDPLQRESEIKKISAAFTELKDAVLPLLRKSNILINFELKARSDEEILNLIKSNPEKLNQTESLYAAYICKDASQKIAFYQQYIAKYPNDWRGYNNLGYLYLQQNKIADAEENFKKANTLNSNEITENNLGVASFANGKYEDAAKYFKAAGEAGNKSARYNEGVLLVKDGDYQTAISRFGSEPTFNLALAQLLTGDAATAEKTLASAKNNDASWANYLAAIISARLGNAEAVIANLKKAIDKDASIKAYASKDREFLAYFENDAFKTLVK
jgi:Flp pilus assembly protein TadD